MTDRYWTLEIENAVGQPGFSVMCRPSEEARSGLFAVVLGCDPFSGDAATRQTEIQRLKAGIRAMLASGGRQSAIVTHLGAETPLWTSDKEGQGGDALAELLELGARDAGLFGPWWKPTALLIRSEACMRNIMQIQIAYLTESGQMPLGWGKDPVSQWPQAVWPKRIDIWLLTNSDRDIIPIDPSSAQVTVERKLFGQLPTDVRRDGNLLEWRIDGCKDVDSFACYEGWETRPSGDVIRLVPPKDFSTASRVCIATYSKAPDCAVTLLKQPRPR